MVIREKFLTKVVSPVHDDALGHATVALLVFPQRLHHRRLHGVVQLGLGGLVEVGGGHEPRAGIVQRGHQRSTGLGFVECVMIRVISTNGIFMITKPKQWC